MGKSQKKQRRPRRGVESKQRLARENESGSYLGEKGKDRTFPQSLTTTRKKTEIEGMKREWARSNSANIVF